MAKPCGVVTCRVVPGQALGGTWICRTRHCGAGGGTDTGSRLTGDAARGKCTDDVTVACSASGPPALFKACCFRSSRPSALVSAGTCCSARGLVSAARPVKTREQMFQLISCVESSAEQNIPVIAAARDSTANGVAVDHHTTHRSSSRHFSFSTQ